MMLFSWSATKKLHNDMIKHVLHAPVNLYFDTTPIGRILNKFSKDLNMLENEFGYETGSFLAMIYMLVYVIVVAVFAVKWIAFLLPIILLISYLLVKRTASSIRETVRLQATTKSPLLSHLGETMSGASTIRAYGKTD
jgi:ATP-binding cassette subfamily C (CFTR/MRP) protein 3